MMKKNLGRKRLALLLSVAMVVTFMPNLAFADTGKEAAKTEVPAAEMAFVDMPQNWSTAALKNAVSNGLISGYDVDGKKYIKPVGNLTRAEMATIVNRGFGATEKAELKGVTDVTAKAWYAPELQKAVKMGTFKLDRLMRGDSSITRQEAFTVLARAFKVTCKDNQKALAKFTDGKAVEAYAKDAMGGLIEGGYLAGASGKLNPTGNITRAEFAKIMDSLVVQYVTKASTVTKVADKGNVMVNVPGVTLKGVTINGDLIVGDGVGTGDLNLDSVKVTGRTVVRGGGVDSIKITGTSDIQSIVVDNMNNEVRIYTAEGVTVKKVEADKAVVLDGNFTNVIVIGAGADITVSKGSKVETMTLSKSAESPKVDVQGSVGTLATAAPNTKIEVSGKVNSIAATADAKGTAVNVGKTGEATSVLTAAPNTKIEVSGTVGCIGAATGSTGTTVTANAGSKVDSITATNPKDVVSDGAGKVPPTTTAPADKPVAPPTVTEKPGEPPKVDVPPVKPTPPPATGGGSGGGTDLVAEAKTALNGAITKAIPDTNTILSGIATLSLNGHTATVTIDTNTTAKALDLFGKDFLGALFNHAEISKVKVGTQPDVVINRTDASTKKASQYEIMLNVAKEAKVAILGTTPITDLKGKSVNVTMYGKSGSTDYSDTYTVTFK